MAEAAKPPEHVLTLDDAELTDLRTSLQMRIENAGRLMTEPDVARSPALLELISEVQERLGRLATKLATRECPRG